MATPEHTWKGEEEEGVSGLQVFPSLSLKMNSTAWPGQVSHMGLGFLPL